MTTEFVTKALNRVNSRKIVIDVGGGEPFQKNLGLTANKRGLFLTIDRSLISIPTIRGDLHQLPIKNMVADAVVCKAVLEHVENPHQVVAEIYRILKPGGLVYLWVPFLYPYHPGKDYGDYFRFTQDGVRLLLKRFKQIKISASLGYWQTIAALLPKPLSILISPIGWLLDTIVPVGHQRSGWHILATK